MSIYTCDYFLVFSEWQSQLHYKQECIPVECILPAAVAVSWEVCLSVYWDTPPRVGLETPLGVGLETHLGQTPQPPPWVWSWRPPPCGQNS